MFSAELWPGGFSSEVDMKWKDGTPKSQGNAFTSWKGKGSSILNDNAAIFKIGTNSYEGWKSRATTEFKKSPGDNVLEEIRQLRHGGAYSKAKKEQK